jgi:acetyl-CoA carboxylase biotin carboxyl carrier protein
MAAKTQNGAGEGAQQPWGVRDLKELIDVLVGREITEFEMEQGGVKIRIKRGNCYQAATPASVDGVSMAPATMLPPGVAPSPFPAPAMHPSNASHAPAEPLPAESLEGLHLIKSPIVGTFYTAPAPSAPPFVKPGDVIQVGQVVCIVEAMKLMNEIESDVAGEIVRSYVENGQPVEYGQSLFAIKPSHKR